MNEHVKTVNRALSPSDVMYEGNPDHYFSVGSSALKNILHAIAVAETRPSRILDFGCGAGRVTRWIVNAFPMASIEGCDVREPDLEFVAYTFGARTWQSGTNIAKLSPASTYDLIWVGSVFTHLSKDNSIELFDKLSSWLNVGGVLVLTSHGRRVAERGPGHYGIDNSWARVLAAFLDHGFGYADYSDTPGYGISLTQLHWWIRLITSRPNLRLISMTEHAWDDHQDVIGVQRGW